MTVDELLQAVKGGQPVSFAQTMAVIDGHYHYRPCRFRNGLGADALVNEAGVNEGSCRIFAFASLHGLDVSHTLALFGDYYRVEVLANPDGGNHQNIRAFMRHGWAGIEFHGQPLTPR